MTEKTFDLNRRAFMGAAVGAAGALGLGLAGTASASIPAPRPDYDGSKAPDGEPLRAALVGCGGRGTGAALNFLDAGPNLSIVALADVLKDRLDGCREKLAKERNQKLDDANCFIGFDAYKEVLDLDVDVVLLATPPHFRPEQFRAAVQARKHAFLEKPVAVDPVGARSVMASSRKAQKAGLSVVTGTQRRHQWDYTATYDQVKAGAIGRIVSANCYWNGGQLWYRNRAEGWSDMEYMIRDWVNWCWLSGDHIVEQHVHNLDVIYWFTGKIPQRAVGFGSRQRRITGDQFDNFSIDYVYDDAMHVHSMCRQISGCKNSVSEFVMGTEGYTNCSNTIWNPDGSVKWRYKKPKGPDGKDLWISPYVQEHIDLVTAIRTGKQIVEAENTATSSLVAVMGRTSAYTGKQVTYEEMMGSKDRMGPEDYAMGPLDIKAVIPVPGKK